MATPLKPTDGEEYLKAFADAVRNRRAEDFYEKLEDLLQPNRLDWLHIDKDLAKQVLVPDNNLLLAGFHYTSPSIGKWRRVVLMPPNPKDVLDLKPLELAQHEEAYHKAPIDINIPVSKHLREPFWINLGSTEKNPECAPVATLSSDQKDKLRELFEHFDNTQFYNLILGLDTFTDHQQAMDSLSNLKKELAGIGNVAFPEAKSATKAKKSTKGRASEEVDPVDALTWRAFVFSFFLAIRLRDPVWVLVLPLFEDGLNSLPDHVEASLPPTTYVAALTNPDHTIIETARKVLLPVVRMLTNVELRVTEAFGSQSVVAFGSQSVVVLENTVRLCTMIDKRVQRGVNQYRTKLGEKLKVLGVSVDPDSDDKAEKWLKEALQMTGADPQMLKLLDRLEKAAESGDSDKELKAGKTFFLHSEPGCGKERLAHLCHLFSQRAGGKHQFVVSEMEELKKKDILVLAKLIRADRASNLKGASDVKKFLKSYSSFGYTSFNSGLLNEKNFEDLMFSSVDGRPGALYLTHLLRGTLFLDECNTLEPKLANQLLRAFEEPYQIIVRDKHVIKEEEINVQVVFGSNRSPDEFLSEGFNSAFVFRIAKQPFRIPPLRERKVDIAIFVNGYFVKHNEDLAKKDKGKEQLRRISLEGLRVINGLGTNADFFTRSVLVDTANEPHFAVMPADQIVGELRAGRLEVAALFSPYIEEVLTLPGFSLKVDFLDLVHPLQTSVLVCYQRHESGAELKEFLRLWDGIIERLRGVIESGSDWDLLTQVLVESPKTERSKAHLPRWDIRPSVDRLAQLDAFISRGRPGWEALGLDTLNRHLGSS